MIVPKTLRGQMPVLNFGDL